MANNKILTLDDTNGGLKEVAGATTGGVGDANSIPALDSNGRLALGMMPVGVAAEIKTGNAFEAITANALVYLRSDGTVANASNVSGGHYAEGWANNSAAIGAAVQVNFEGTISGLTGLTPEGRVYLGASGALTQTIPAGSGVLYQEVGVAISATEVNFTNSGTKCKRA